MKKCRPPLADQLKQIELAPFFAVTRGNRLAPGTTDALLAAHIRFQGLQGNIPRHHRPHQSGPASTQFLVGTAGASRVASGWRHCRPDALGARSAIILYDATAGAISRIVKSPKMLAGNDLLYVADFARGTTNGAAELANVKDTILWFRERYERTRLSDCARAETVLRILKVKATVV